ncbi:MAG: NUDIX domain-containing protein [Blastochloris viridis]|uniref:NUDIX domain-containing protein n=1 Tax=Blastochloris viridis TaxID=1079 RepID=A0A6N4R2I7_BLAVI|nr:MAG: NUDIX domain-containing protein [Blastochloris viridis]
MAERHKVVPAVFLVFENPQGEVLLQLRQNTGYADGYWSIPSGHFEPNEHVLKVAQREAKEELDVTMEEQDMHFIALHHIRRTDGLDGMNFYFKITKWQGTPSNAEPAKCGGVQWFSKTKLPENIFPELAEVLGSHPPHRCLSGKFQPRLGTTPTEQKV